MFRMRQIPIEAIDEAARHVYQAAVRTPLIRLDLPFADDVLSQRCT